MRPIRRTDMSPRVEMTPMIDVIFLLITFFIYSLIMMIRAEVLPVNLTPIGTGAPARPQRVEAITIDRDGRLFFNRQPVTSEQLDTRLAEMAADPKRGTLYLAMEAQGDADRGPVVLELIERVRKAGIDTFSIVGPPRPALPTTTPAPSPTLPQDAP